MLRYIYTPCPWLNRLKIFNLGVTMLQSVGSYFLAVPTVIEKGLAHPTFLGRAVSWGAFYGVLALVVKKVAVYAQPYIKKLWDSAKEKMGYPVEKVTQKEEKPVPHNVAMISHGKNEYHIHVTALLPSATPIKTEDPYVEVNEDLEGKNHVPSKKGENEPITTESLSSSSQPSKVDGQKKNTGFFG